MSVLKSNVFTAEITNDSITITESMGVRMLSVYNPTATAGTVTGTQKLEDITPSPINLEEGETYTVASIEASVLGEVVITAPVGCTLKITAIV
jgi:hypothetical protein